MARLVQRGRPAHPICYFHNVCGAEGNSRILIVEDHEDSADIFGLLLQEVGFGVVIARNGNEALGKATEIKPLLVFVDIGLPDISGFEVCKILRMRLPQTKIVAVTGYDLPRMEAQLHASGFHEAIQKPVDIEALRKLLGHAGSIGVGRPTPFR